MRFKEYLITEGGKSGGERYNTELACLLAYTNKKSTIVGFDPTIVDFDPKEWWDENFLHNPELVYTDIIKHLPTNYDKKIFDNYYTISKKQKQFIINKIGIINKLFWVGGLNAKGDDSNPADVEFFGKDCYGISVKGKGAITLSNMSPSRIGLSDVKGDAIRYYCDKIDPTMYNNWKKSVILSTLKIADNMNGKTYSPDTKSPYYNITLNTDKSYKIGWKTGTKILFKDYTMTALLSDIGRNPIEHSVFGCHLTKNVSEFKNLTTKVFKTAAEAITPLIQQSFADHAKVEKILNFSNKSFFYQSPKNLYYIPAKDEFLTKPLEIKRISYNISDEGASGILLKVGIGRQGMDDYSTIDLWLRYANRVFGSNSTVRIQELKNPENIAWEKLV